VLDEAGKVLLEQKVGTTPQRHAGSVRKNAAQPACVGNGNALAVGEPVVERPGARSNRGHARNVRLIGESRKKDDRLDARTLVRLARIDPQLLAPDACAALPPTCVHW
jgi:transposase